MSTSAKDIQLRELKDTISQLNTTIASQNQLIVSLQTALASKDEAYSRQIALLNEQIAYLTRKLFGSSSEKRDDIEGQLSLFDEAESLASDNTEISKLETTVKAHTRKSKKLLAEKLKGIPVEQVIHDIPEDERICEICGTNLEEIGREVVRRELEYIPAKVKVIEHVSVHYGCPSCKANDESFIVKAPVPKALMKHSIASDSSVAWTMYQKYANGLPLYRQEKDWQQYGIELDRSQLAYWIIYCANNYFKPVYNYLHEELLKRQFLMADETTVQVLNEPGRAPQNKSYMWMFRSGEDGLPTIILYGYTPTRGGYNAEEFLEGFSGYLETDGYQGYNKVAGITRCCCWAHVRRYFIDAVPKGKEHDYSNPAVQGVSFCNKLFQYEDNYKKQGLSYEKRGKMRLEQEKPVLDAFWSWLDNQHPVRNSRMDKAVNYVRNRKPFLENYLEDGRCSISNNLSENAIRPFTVGRKNWLFSESQEGAEASAIVYSMVEMAKAHNLNIYKYLKFLLEQRPNNKMNNEQLQSLLPWSQDAIEKCHN